MSVWAWTEMATAHQPLWGIAWAKSDLLQQQTTLNELKKPSPRKDKISSNLSRLAKLWIPFGKKLVLEGVIVSGNTIFNEPQKTLALGAAWQDTFSAKPFQPEQSKLFLDNLGDIGSYSPTAPPDYWLFRRAVSRGPNSSPGPDGIPYQAWRASTDRGIATLIGIDQVPRNGSEPEAHLNNSCMCFLVKG